MSVPTNSPWMTVDQVVARMQRTETYRINGGILPHAAYTAIQMPFNKAFWDSVYPQVGIGLTHHNRFDSFAPWVWAYLGEGNQAVGKVLQVRRFRGAVLLDSPTGQWWDSGVRGYTKGVASGYSWNGRTQIVDTALFNQRIISYGDGVMGLGPLTGDQGAEIWVNGYYVTIGRALAARAIANAWIAEVRVVNQDGTPYTGADAKFTVSHGCDVFDSTRSGVPIGPWGVTLNQNMANFYKDGADGSTSGWIEVNGSMGWVAVGGVGVSGVSKSYTDGPPTPFGNWTGGPASWLGDDPPYVLTPAQLAANPPPFYVSSTAAPPPAPPPPAAPARVFFTGSRTVPIRFSGIHRGLHRPAWRSNGGAAIPVPTYAYDYARSLKAEVDGQEEVCFWSNIETSAGTYDWTRVDKWINAVAPRRVVWTVYGTPTFYQKYPGEAAPWPSWPGIQSPPTVAGHAALANFVRAVVARYGSQLAGLEVWNEPTFPWTSSATTYTDRFTPAWSTANAGGAKPFFSGTATDLADVAFTIKSAAGSVPVLGFGLVDSHAASNTNFQKAANAPVSLAGATGTSKDHIDAWSVHFYDYSFTPNALIDVLIAYGVKIAATGRVLPLWVTEVGAENSGVFTAGDSRAVTLIRKTSMISAAMGMQSIIFYGHFHSEDAAPNLGDPANSPNVSAALGQVQKLAGRTITKATETSDGEIILEFSNGAEMRSTVGDITGGTAEPPPPTPPPVDTWYSSQQQQSLANLRVEAQNLAQGSNRLFVVDTSDALTTRADTVGDGLNYSEQGAAKVADLLLPTVRSAIQASVSAPPPAAPPPSASPPPAAPPPTSGGLDFTHLLSHQGALNDSQQFNEYYPLYQANPARGWASRPMLTKGADWRGGSYPSWYWDHAQPERNRWLFQDFWTRPTIWFVVWDSANRNGRGNSRVLISAMQLFILRDGSLTWELVLDSRASWAEMFYRDATNKANNDDPSRAEPGGFRSYLWPDDVSYIVHGGDGNEKPIVPNPGTIRGVMFRSVAWLVLDNPSGPDDRDTAELYMSLGADVYPTENPKAGEMSNGYITAIGGTRFKKVTRNPQAWQWVNVAGGNTDRATNVIPSPRQALDQSIFLQTQLPPFVINTTASPPPVSAPPPAAPPPPAGPPAGPSDPSLSATLPAGALFPVESFGVEQVVRLADPTTPGGGGNRSQMEAAFFANLNVYASFDSGSTLRSTANLSLSLTGNLGKRRATTANQLLMTLALTGSMRKTFAAPTLDYHWPSPAPRKLSGRSVAGATIDLTIDGTVVTGAATANSSGVWEYTYNGSVGSHRLQAQARMGADFSAKTNEVLFYVAAAGSGALVPRPATPISSSLRDRVIRTSSPEFPITLLEVHHPQLAAPVRVCDDTKEVVSKGHTYPGLPFRLKMPEDIEETLPQATLEIDNVGRELVRWIELSGGARGATVVIRQIIRSAPDKHEFEVTLDVHSIELNDRVVQVQLSFENIFDRALSFFTYRPDSHPAMF